tara:strand:- start:4 stop:498 length:495 start_codon:yes stop_codon:yes gene_type:complete
MAETLSVADMLPNKFEPKRKNRFVLAIEGIDSFLIQESARPDFKLGEQKLNFINSYRKISNGRGEWQNISVKLHDPIAPSGAQQTMEWIRTHYESVSGRAGYADFYKRDIQIKILDPVGTVVELWDIKGAFLTNVGFDALNYTSDGEPFMITLTIAFDNCIFQF